MWKLVRKMFVNIVFVTVLYIVRYTNRDSNAIVQVQHLKYFFLNTYNSTNHFTKIRLFIYFLKKILLIIN
jgi:hypothetical protein